MIWVCTVCPDLSVRKLRIITVALPVACPLRMQVVRDRPWCPPHLSWNLFSSSTDSRRASCQLLGERMGTKYWLAASERLAQEQCC